MNMDDIEIIKTLILVSKATNGLETVENNKELDNHKSVQETIRDKYISDILSTYVDSCKDKFDFKKEYKKKLFNLCKYSIITILIFMIIISISLVKNTNGLSLIISFISACATFIGAFIGMLNIITKYVFPTDDERYITEIVKLIQNNDLANKKENLNYKMKEHFHEVKRKEDLEIDEKDGQEIDS